LAFERIVNQPKRGLGDKALATIHTAARAQQQPLLIAAASLLDSDELQARARNSLARFIADIARWRGMYGSAEAPLPSAGEGLGRGEGGITHADLARIVLDESGYTAMLQADRSAESAGRLENLAELARAMEEYDNLSGFLEHVSLVMANDEDRDREKVTIMTIHAAKGLEFDTVYLPGWEEGIFPSQRALDEGGLASLEEERRLAYVAITRAKRRSTVIHAANRRIYGQWTSSLPSRFVAELPEPHIEQETTMSGGESLWRAQWSERGDPFAHLGPAQAMRGSTRGPGWQRAASGGRFNPEPTRVIEARASAVSLGNKGRDDLTVGQRVFHDKFGQGTIAAIEGNKLEIDFEHAGRKKVLDSFVSAGER
jgi:DNA helicase-2/ATP-dependent DNA helicase PcrA